MSTTVPDVPDASIYDVPVDPEAPNNPHSATLRLVGSGHRVLELGCAGGHVTRHLVAAGNEVVGVEIDPDAAAAARQFTDHVHVADLDRIKVSGLISTPFDVIVMADVLEHVRRPDAVLADVVTLLRPDGRLVISIPNMAHVDVRLALLEGRIEYQPDGLLDHTHLRWFTKSSLRTLLADAGFVATELERVVVPVGGSNVACDPAVHGVDTMEFIAADPEHLSYQYVVSARRAVEASGHDVLADDGVTWPPPRLAAHRDAAVAEVQALRADVARLEGEVAAWEGSTVARVSRPVRAVSARIRRRLRR